MSNNQKQIAAFTTKHVRYFLPPEPPVTIDASKEWNQERSHFMLVECNVRPVRSEYTSYDGISVEYVDD